MKKKSGKFYVFSPYDGQNKFYATTNLLSVSKDESIEVIGGFEVAFNKVDEFVKILNISTGKTADEIKGILNNLLIEN